ncbi:hypothetical protein OEB94_35645, partial [Streptomyces sp. ICN988]|nr:hypothetical protein [Streptomyces sp. ICN988]
RPTPHARATPTGDHPRRLMSGLTRSRPTAATAVAGDMNTCQGESGGPLLVGGALAGSPIS